MSQVYYLPIFFLRRKPVSGVLSINLTSNSSNAGAEMEVNLSHKTRQEILTTQDLTHSDLFKNALNEVMQLIKMVK